MNISNCVGLLLMTTMSFAVVDCGVAAEPEKAMKVTKHSEMGEHHRVKSTITVSKDLGKVDLHTETWTRNHWLGYRSGMYFALEDGNGNILFKSPEVTSGVNAYWMLGASDRTKTRSYKVDSKILKKAKRVLVRHYEAGKILPGAKTFLKDAKHYVKEGKDIYNLIQSK